MKDETRRHLPLFALILCGAFLWRLAVAGIDSLQGLSNFSPLLSMAFLGAIFLPKRFAIWLPITLVAVADLIVYRGSNWSVWYAAPLVYACLALAGVWGLSLRGQRSAPSLLLRVFGCTVGFYLLSNGICWLLDPGYSKTLGGLAQCLTVGKPGFLPTWMFLRNSLCGDLLFGAFLILVFNRHVASSKQEQVRLRTPLLRSV